MNGALVASVYFVTMTGLVAWTDLPPGIALVWAYAVAVALHFFLSRQFVFATCQGYALRHGSQGVRYLLVAGGSYVATAVIIEVVPESLDTSVLEVFYAAAVLQAVVTFFALRYWVFHSAAPQDEER